MKKSELKKDVIKYKNGDNLYYKNQYMDESKNVIVSNVEEYSNGEIGGITIKFENGNESRILT